MDIPAQLQQISVHIHKDRLVSALKKVTASACPTVEKIGVRPVDVLHYLAQIPFRGFDDEVIVLSKRSCEGCSRIFPGLP